MHHFMHTTKGDMVICACGIGFANIKALEFHLSNPRIVQENAPQHSIAHSPAAQHRDTKNY